MGGRAPDASSEGGLRGEPDPGSGRAERSPGSTWCVVLAGGQGRRFGGPKQLERLGDRRLVDWAVDVASDECDGVVLVLPERVSWDGLPVNATVPGGDTQFASLSSGVARVPPTASVIVIHDAAHPLVDGLLFRRVLAAVRAGGADGAVPALPVRDTPVHVHQGRVLHHLLRDGLFLMQAPMAFRATSLRRALAGALASVRPTDAATLVRKAGGVIKTVPGDPANVHVTTLEELAVARRLLRTDERQAKMPLTSRIAAE